MRLIYDYLCLHKEIWDVFLIRRKFKVFEYIDNVKYKVRKSFYKKKMMRNFFFPKISYIHK